MTGAFAASSAVRAIGIALIWFVLQGAIVGAVVAALLLLARRASASLRYVVACAGLVTMAMMPVVTAARQWTPAPVVVEVSRLARAESAPIAAAISAAADGGWPARLTPARVAPLVVLTWITGVLLLTAQLFGGWLQIVRIRRSARLLDAREWADRIVRVGERLQVSRVVPIFESTLVGVPVVIGWLRPMILVPAGVLAGLSPDYIDAILAHELAHIRRGDYVVNALQRVVEIVLFYHPAVWWVSAVIRREREHCCDDLAAPLSPSRLTYARALVALEEWRGRAPALAMAAARSSLFARVRRIVDPSSAVESLLPKGAVMTIVSSLVALVLASAISVGHAAPAPALKAPAVMQAPVPVVSAPTPPVVPIAHMVQGVGSIHGTVTDQRDGRIPGATITLDTIGREGASRTTHSDRTGQFAVTGLPDGAYLLTVKLPGFGSYTRRVDVTVGGDLTENVQLRLGSKEETLNVFPAGRDAAPDRQTVSMASVSTLLDAAKVASDAGRLGEAEGLLRQALAILHASDVPAIPSPRPGVVRIGGDIKEPRKIVDVPPIYPRDARAAGIQGTVTIEATIDRDGSVQDALVLQGVPELNDAALQAVRQWVYTPTLLSGSPVAIVMTVTVTFSLK